MSDFIDPAKNQETSCSEKIDKITDDPEKNGH